MRTTVSLVSALVVGLLAACANTTETPHQRYVHVLKAQIHALTDLRDSVARERFRPGGTKRDEAHATCDFEAQKAVAAGGDSRYGLYRYVGLMRSCMRARGFERER